MFKTNILFNGYYGQRNTGDDAFVEVANWGAQKFWHLHDFRFLSRTDALPSVRSLIKGYPITFPKTYSFQRGMLVNNTDVFISAGGSTFHNITPGSIKDLAAQTKKKNSKLKLGAIGVSVGPFINCENEKRVVEYLKSMDFISVRDQRSFNYVDSLDLPFNPVNSFDLAAILPQIYGDSPVYAQANAKSVVGVSVCNYESYQKDGSIKNEKRRNEFIQKLLAHIKNQVNCKFRFFIFNGNEQIGDRDLTFNMIASLEVGIEYEVVDYNQRTEETWKSIKECSVMISTRLHAGIFACFAGIPFILVEYHKKCSDFIEDVGQNKLYRVYDGEASPETTSDIVAEILSGGQYLKPSNRLEMEQKALLNFTSFEL